MAIQGILRIVLFLSILAAASALVIGVDLGTRFFKIGLLQAGKPYHVILNVESQRKTSTAVAFVSESEREFGTFAQNLATRIPEETVLLATTLLGRTAHPDALHWYNQSLLPTKWSVDDSTGSYRLELPAVGLSFSVEEIVAMILEYGQSLASAEAGVPILDAVIAVPPYFTHQQRVALFDAARIAGITITGLINDNTAVALLYGVEKEKEFKKEGPTKDGAEDANLARDVLFFDMGATSTRASVVRYGSTQSKLDKKGNKTVGEYWIKSVAWDETLGSMAFDNVIVNVIASKFNEKKGIADGSEKDVRNVPKAVAKMRKAAEKAKEVLSTISTTTVSIEALVEDTDFRMEVSNQDLSVQAAALLDRVIVVIKRALTQAEVDVATLHSVEIVGGGSRMPVVQNVIRELVGKELGVSLNGDDAVALGATLYAAKVSPAHRMREFVLRDASPYAISVDVLSSDDQSKTPAITREIFSAGGKMPVNKKLTLSRSGDFDVLVRYSPDQRLPAGISENISLFHISGVATAIERHADEIVEEESKDKEDEGEVEAHATGKKAKASVSLHLTPSGTVELARHDASITVLDKGVEAKNEALSGDQADEGDSVPPEGEPAEGQETKAENLETKSESDETKTEGSKTDAKDTQEDKKDSETATSEQTGPKTRVKYIKTSMSQRTAEQSARVPLNDTQVSDSVAVLAKLAVADKARRELEAAKNELETHVYNVRNFLTSDTDVDKVCSEEEKDKIVEQLTAAEDWLYEEGESADLSTYRSKLVEVQAYSQQVRFRHTELRLLPEVIAKARESVAFILEKIESWNSTKPWINETDKVSLINRTVSFDEWLKTAEEEQAKLSLQQDPVLTSAEVERKINPVENKFKKLAKTPKPLPPKAPLNGTNTWGNYTRGGAANKTKTSQDGSSKSKTSQGGSKKSKEQDKQQKQKNGKEQSQKKQKKEEPKQKPHNQKQQKKQEKPQNKQPPKAEERAEEKAEEKPVDDGDDNDVVNDDAETDKVGNEDESQADNNDNDNQGDEADDEADDAKFNKWKTEL